MITAVVLTKNEEKSIKDCLKSLSFCDEIILVDDYSTDKTIQIASSFGVVVLRRNLNNDFSSQRNFGLDKAKGPWVLFVDADERIPENLKLEIISKINDPMNKNVGYFIKRRTFFLGRELKFGQISQDKVLRLAKKDAGRWKRKVHECWDVKGKVDNLKNPLDHFTYDSLDDFIHKINVYSDIHAESLLEEKKYSNLFKIIFYPPFKFFDNFILKRGFLDGIYGLVFAFLISFHSFLGWSKLWLLQRNTKLKKY